MTYYGTHRNEGKAVRSVTARMREQQDERAAEAEDRRELEASEHAERCARDPFYAAYGWDEDTIDDPPTRRAIESVTIAEEQREEDRQLAAEEGDDERGRSRHPTRSAVKNVEREMRKRGLLDEQGDEADFADSISTDAEIGKRVTGAMSTKTAVEMVGKLSDEELRDAMEAGIADADADDQDDGEYDEDAAVDGARHAAGTRRYQDDDAGVGDRGGALS